MKQPVKKSVVKAAKPLDYGDAFTNELAKNLDELMKKISVPDPEFDRKTIGAGIMKEFARVVSPSDHRFPGTYSSYFEKENVKWNADATGEASWMWYGELMRQYKQNDLDKNAATRKKYEDGLAKIYGKHKTAWGSFELPWGNVIKVDSKGYMDSTALILSISFVQPSLPKSELQVAYIDYFKPLLYTTPKVKDYQDAIDKLYYSFNQSGFSDEEQYQGLLPLFLDLAGKSERRAFGIYIHYFDEKVSQRLKESLGAAQRQNLKKMADEYLANYQKPGYSYLDGPAKAPAPVIKAKPVAKTDNPCYPGEKTKEYNAMVETKLGLTRIFSFDCATQVYLVAYIKNDKLHFGYLPLAEVSTAKRSMSDIFICSKCNGSGGMKAAEYTHAYGFVWVREYPTDCNACWGKGFCPNGRCNRFGQ